MLWHSEAKQVRCNLCRRQCLIGEGMRGFCRVRENRKGKLYTLVYGKLVALEVDPIEKKPLFHFYPGSTTFSIASVGCNFTCNFCCNATISQAYRSISGRTLAPEQVVNMARRAGCRIVSYTYTEPTVNFEFNYETAKLAFKLGLKNTWVTNGYASEEAIKKIAKYLAAVTVDFKASGDPKFYEHLGTKVEYVFEFLKHAQKQKIFIEVTNLIIPKIGDSVERCSELAQWINDNLGPNIPFHVLQFFPAFKLADLPPTPIETLERCIEAAREAGLRYVYIGNVPGHPAEHTYCYNCNELLVEREGFKIKRINLLNQRCPTCGFKLNLLM